MQEVSSNLSSSCRETQGNRGSYMTKQLEGERVAKGPQQIAQQIAKDALPPAASPKKPSSVRMKIASVQYAGAIATPKGDIPSWRITFLLDAEHLLATSLTVQATGANDVIEARESGLNILRRFAQELLDAAAVFHA
ncbi:MAG TPA: hypothetical protein VKT99_20005 [Xanthobacteraceae bacterium]|nr:hypothetical protein [Xanthobacteraceae bacterium]